MEQDDPISCFHPSIATTRRRNPPINPVILILILPILVLLLLFFIFHPLLSHIPKSIWDFINVFLVFFAILCGVLALASTNSPPDPVPPLSVKSRRRRTSPNLRRDEMVHVTSRIDKIHKAPRNPSGQLKPNHIKTEPQIKPQTAPTTKPEHQKPESQLKLQTTLNTQTQQQKPDHIKTEPQLKLHTTPNTNIKQQKPNHIKTEPQTAPNTKHKQYSFNKLKTDLCSFNQKLYQTVPRSPLTISETTTELATQLPPPPPPPPPPLKSFFNALFKSGRKKKPFPSNTSPPRRFTVPVTLKPELKRKIQMKPPSPPLQRKPEALRRRPAGTTTTDVGEPFGPSPIYFPSPDVNVKADGFISRLKDEWRMENVKFN